MIHNDFDAASRTKPGWARRCEPDGEMSWWWTLTAETALDLNRLLQSAEGSQN